MKRKILSILLLLAVCLCLTVPVLGAENLIYDQADLLSDREEAKLAEKLAEVSAANNAQIVVATVGSTDGATADYYVEYFYDSMKLGYGDRRDGVLLLVCMDIREYRILSNGYAATAISPGIIDDISDIIVSDLSEGDYYDAFAGFARECNYYLDGYRNGFPFNAFFYLMISAAAGVVVAGIVVLILKSQLRSVHKQDQAHVYIKRDSMRLTTNRDIFLYRNVTRRKIETSGGSSSGRSSSGSSSRSIGGGKF